MEWLIPLAILGMICCMVCAVIWYCNNKEKNKLRDDLRDYRDQLQHTEDMLQTAQHNERIDDLGREQIAKYQELVRQNNGVYSELYDLRLQKSVLEDHIKEYEERV